MKQIAIYTLFSLLLLVSCTHEMDEQIIHEEKVYMNISTHALNPSMTQVRILVTDALSGQVIINQYPVQPEATGDYKLSVRTGELNFYVFLNEPSTLTPKLSDIKHNSTIPALMIEWGELPTDEPDDSSTKETNLPAFAWTKATVRASGGTIKYGEASTDGGITWTSSLDVSLERLATKVSLALRNNIPGNSNEMIINKVSAIHVPDYEFLLPKTYASTHFNSQIIYDTPLNISSNTTHYYKVFTDFIMPEYIFDNPADQEMAVCLEIEAEYNNKKVKYYIPVRGNLDVEDYTLRRNNHYIIKATFATEGETIYIPEVKYQVAEWSNVDIESEFVEESAITFSHRWEAGTNINGTTIHVNNNDYIDFYFTLSYPKGATWVATLTNGIDFMFDTTDGAVSNGITREGKEYKIRIKPRRETELNGIQTEFYITVNNGAGNIELNLPNPSAATQSRYTIIQTPN